MAYLEPCVILSLLHVRIYSGIFRMLCNARISRTLPYPELCLIQNFGGRFETQMPSAQVPGFRCLVHRFQVSGVTRYADSSCQAPGTMCQVSGIRCNVKISKTLAGYNIRPVKMKHSTPRKFLNEKVRQRNKLQF